jgi:hypothetical protein
MPPRSSSLRASAAACALLALLAAAGSSHARGPDGPQSARRTNAPIEAVFQAPSPADVALGELRDHPLDHLGRRVRFLIQVESHPASWNPYVTRFGSGDYAALSAWADEQRLWQSGDWHDPMPLLFFRRGGAAERALGEAPQFARFVAVATVRQVFLGRPWIEIESADRLEQELTEGTVLHASRGLSLMQAEEWGLAAEDFERALAADLPAWVRGELEALRDSCRQRQGNPPPKPEPERNRSGRKV